MSAFSYYAEPERKTVDVVPCKLCGRDPIISKGNYGYCGAGISIKCKTCGIEKSDRGSFNEGGVNDFYLGVIGQWNRIMK